MINENFRMDFWDSYLSDDGDQYIIPSYRLERLLADIKLLESQNEIYREALKYIQTYKHPDYFSHSRGSIFDVTSKALQDAQKLAGGK